MLARGGCLADPIPPQLSSDCSATRRGNSFLHVDRAPPIRRYESEDRNVGGTTRQDKNGDGCHEPRGCRLSSAAEERPQPNRSRRTPTTISSRQILIIPSRSRTADRWACSPSANHA